MNCSKKIVLGIMCMSIAATVSGCVPTASDSQNEGSTGSGTLKVLLTDKPFPFEYIEEAVVTITRIEVRVADAEYDEDDDAGENENGGQESDLDPAGSDGSNENGAEGENSNDNGDDNSNDSGDEDTEDQDGPFLVVFEGAESFNLLELQNGVTATLVDVPLAAGSYSQIRLIVDSGMVLLTDGRQFDLNVPSGAQTGIKLHFQFDIEDQQETALLMDVDVSKAFHPIPSGQVNEASSIQGFQFRPSLAVRITEIEQTGAITGLVTDSEGTPLADVSVTATSGGEEITTTATAEDGTYMLSALEAGLYTVTFSQAGFEDAQLPDIEVTAGQDTAGADVMLSAAAE